MKTNGTPNEALYRQRIWKEILFLYHFISYLTYVSNGSPKKMTLFFEKNIRKGKYLEKENKISRLNPSEAAGMLFINGRIRNKKTMT